MINPDKRVLENLLGLYNKGFLKEALDQSEKLINDFPKSFFLWNLIGAINQKLHQLKKAEKGFRKASVLNPLYPDSFNNLGVTLKDQGKFIEAIDSFKKAISLKPDYAQAYNNMANALQEQDKLKDSIKTYKKAISIKPDYIEAYINMANVLQLSGSFKEAIEAYRKIISLNSNYVEAYFNLGLALKSISKYEEAVEVYKLAISLRPNYLEAYNNMANALQAQGRFEEAIKAYKKAISLKPDYTEAYYNLANTLQEHGKFKEAIKTYKQAISLKPDYIEAYNNMANALQEQGNFEEAVKVYESIISINSDFAEAHRNLSNFKRYFAKDSQFLQMESAYKNQAIDEEGRCQLSFALAKAYEDLSIFDKAFQCLKVGNSLRKKQLNYNLKQDEELFTKIRSMDDKIRKQTITKKINKLPHIPVFVIGMPRSGTTLVEQIISSHSHAFGAGELVFLEKLASTLMKNENEINLEKIREIRFRYLDDLNRISSGKSYVVDKLPHNFLRIGIICSALPEAKIVHVKRNAAATCWSNYKHYFTSKSLGYSYDLEDVVKYYRLYEGMMEFWQTRYNNKIYNLDYDELTKNHTIEIKQLIKYLELEWEEKCLLPEKNNRRVRTASSQQVRVKIYQGSSENWLKFDHFLNGAFDTIL